jgi:hypothetical protein
MTASLVTQFFTHDKPRFNFAAELLRQVGLLNADIDIDGYDVPDHMDEPVRAHFFKRAKELADPLLFTPEVALEVVDWAEEQKLALCERSKLRFSCRACDHYGRW